MPAPRKYPDEIRERAVRMVFEIREETGIKTGSIVRVAERLGVNKETSLRKDRLDGLVHHSDRGSQYLSIRYSERLAEAGAVASVGSRGDCLLTG
jgi:transposase InsO family protein